MKRQDVVKLRKSIIQDAVETMRQILVPDGPQSVDDFWCDLEGKEGWVGPEVQEARQQVFDYVENALRVLAASDFCRGKDD